MSGRLEVGCSRTILLARQSRQDRTFVAANGNVATWPRAGLRDRQLAVASIGAAAAFWAVNLKPIPTALACNSTPH